MAVEIIRSERERRITLSELVRLVLPQLPEDEQVEVRVRDPVTGRSWPLGSFGTELCFAWPEPDLVTDGSSRTPDDTHADGATILALPPKSR